MGKLANRLSWLAVFLTLAAECGAVVITNPLTLPVAVNLGGTGATNAAAARSNLGAAASGANADITSMLVPDAFTLTYAGNAQLSSFNTGETIIFTGGAANKPVLQIDGSTAQTGYVFLVCPTGGACSPNFTVDYAGTVASTKPCASGFSRETPNLCIANSATSYTAITNNTCTSITAPSGAKTVTLSLALTAIADNTAGIYRFSQARVYTDNTCATAQFGGVQVGALEQVAESVGKVLAENSVNMPAVVSGGNIGLKYVADAGGQSLASYAIVSYTD